MMMMKKMQQQCGKRKRNQYAAFHQSHRVTTMMAMALLMACGYPANALVLAPNRQCRMLTTRLLLSRANAGSSMMDDFYSLGSYSASDLGRRRGTLETYDYSNQNHSELWHAQGLVQEGRQSYEFTEDLLLQEDDDEEEVVPDNAIQDFQKLQTATGSQVMQADLHREVEAARQDARAFFNSHMSDATPHEQLAASMTPQQLPQPAVEALSSSGKKALLTREQEWDLARQIQHGIALHKLKQDFEKEHGRDITRAEWTQLSGLSSTRELRRAVANYRTAKQRLVESNMGLVRAVVRQIINKSKQYQNRQETAFEELCQEGSLGLIRAAELFDANRGLRFSTYATIWIKGVLSNTQVAATQSVGMTLPAREKTKWNKIQKARSQLQIEQRGDQPISFKQLADRTGLTEGEVAETSHRMMRARHVMSLDTMSLRHRKDDDSDDGQANIEDSLASSRDVDVVERVQCRSDLVAALVQNLDPREARLMRLRYGLVDGNPRTMQECANAMGLSKGRIVQLNKICLEKLRQAKEAKSLDEYLMTIA